jgi:hypothetical protein
MTLLALILHRLVRVRVRSESVAGAHLGVQGGVLAVGSRVTISRNVGLLGVQSGVLQAFDQCRGRWIVNLDAGGLIDVNGADLDSDSTPWQPLRLCLDCLKSLSNKTPQVPKHAFHFYAAPHLARHPLCAHFPTARRWPICDVRRQRHAHQRLPEGYAEASPHAGRRGHPLCAPGRALPGAAGEDGQDTAESPA